MWCLLIQDAYFQHMKIGQIIISAFSEMTECDNL